MGFRTKLKSVKHGLFCSKGLYQKAEALYHMGEFEFALMFYHRGQKLRPQIEEFRLGIQRAEKSIEDAIGNTVQRSANSQAHFYFGSVLKKNPHCCSCQLSRSLECKAGNQRGLVLPPK